MMGLMGRMGLMDLIDLTRLKLELAFVRRRQWLWYSRLKAKLLVKLERSLALLRPRCSRFPRLRKRNHNAHERVSSFTYV
jgi:hypothetical protein